MPSSIIRRIAIDMLTATAALTPADFESYEMDKFLSEFKMRWKCGMSLLRHAARESVNDTEDDYGDDDDYDEEDDTDDEPSGEDLGEIDTDTDGEDDDYETEDESESDDDDMPGLVSESEDEDEDEDEYDDLPELANDAESVCSNDYSDNESVCGQF